MLYGIHFWRLHEYDGLDWTVEAKDGGVFDYRKETPDNFVEQYNRHIGNTRRVADIVGMDVELPHAETALANGLDGEKAG